MVVKKLGYRTLQPRDCSTLIGLAPKSFLTETHKYHAFRVYNLSFSTFHQLLALLIGSSMERWLVEFLLQRVTRNSFSPLLPLFLPRMPLRSGLFSVVVTTRVALDPDVALPKLADTDLEIPVGVRPTAPTVVVVTLVAVLGSFNELVEAVVAMTTRLSSLSATLGAIMQPPLILSTRRITIRVLMRVSMSRGTK